MAAAPPAGVLPKTMFSAVPLPTAIEIDPDSKDELGTTARVPLSGAVGLVVPASA